MLNMFRAAHRSSSGALTVFAASGLHTHVVTGRSQVWVETEFPLRLDCGRSPHAYVNWRLQIQLELLVMSGVPLETCWAFNERWNNKFHYKLHLVCYFSWVILRCTDPYILKIVVSCFTIISYIKNIVVFWLKVFIWYFVAWNYFYSERKRILGQQSVLWKIKFCEEKLYRWEI
jgi:hypothetical protein